MAESYDVHVEHSAVYTVTADSPEEAARIVSDGDGGQADWQGSIVETVVVHGEFIDLEDLRSPVPCRGGCGKMLPASKGDECIDCMLRTLDARRALADGAVGKGAAG